MANANSCAKEKKEKNCQNIVCVQVEGIACCPANFAWASGKQSKPSLKSVCSSTKLCTSFPVRARTLFAAPCNPFQFLAAAFVAMLHRRVTFLPSLASGLVALESQQASAGVRSLQQQHAVISPALQRWYSSEVTPDSVKGEDFVYEAPFAGVVRRVKVRGWPTHTSADRASAHPPALLTTSGTLLKFLHCIAATCRN